jgi:geranylgeranyl reductase
LSQIFSGKYTIKYANADNTKTSSDFDYVIGADGANSRVAKAIDAGEYNYAIAFQERIKVSTISLLSQLSVLIIFCFFSHRTGF